MKWPFAYESSCSIHARLPMFDHRNDGDRRQENTNYKTDLFLPDPVLDTSVSDWQLHGCRITSSLGSSENRNSREMISIAAFGFCQIVVVMSALSCSSLLSWSVYRPLDSIVKAIVELSLRGMQYPVSTFTAQSLRYPRISVPLSRTATRRSIAERQCSKHRPNAVHLHCRNGRIGSLCSASPVCLKSV